MLGYPYPDMCNAVSIFRAVPHRNGALVKVLTRSALLHHLARHGHDAPRRPLALAGLLRTATHTYAVQPLGASSAECEVKPRRAIVIAAGSTCAHAHLTLAHGHLAAQVILHTLLANTPARFSLHIASTLLQPRSTTPMTTYVTHRFAEEG